MSDRPTLDSNLDSKTFKEYYYLKKELVDFCKKYNLQTTGGELDLTERIIEFLDSGKRIYKANSSKSNKVINKITLNTQIEKNFVCSERHRVFYTEQIGKKFSFNVVFQKWLKNNSGKTYQDSIEAYYQISEDKKKSKTTIDRQFEYNTYIRDFFIENKDKNLEQAIKCWKFKKGQKGHNRYEKEDLKILK